LADTTAGSEASVKGARARGHCEIRCGPRDHGAHAAQCFSYYGRPTGRQRRQIAALARLWPQAPCPSKTVTPLAPALNGIGFSFLEGFLHDSSYRISPQRLRRKTHTGAGVPTLRLHVIKRNRQGAEVELEVQ